MTNGLDGIAGREFDLVVAGGGIHGVMLFLEASRRGLSVLLVEQEDFGGGASWNGSRILHGGLRYLQRGDLRRVRDSVKARRWFFRRFPDFVSSLPSLMPLYGSGVRRRSIMAGAMGIYEALSGDRNRGVSRELLTRRGRTISSAGVADRFPMVLQEGLKGGALWDEGLVSNAPRVLMESIRWARVLGGVALNYTKALAVRENRGSVDGVLLRDLRTGTESKVVTKRVVLCTGAVEDLSESAGPPAPGLSSDLFLSYNLIVNKPLGSAYAVAVSKEPGRGHLYFLVPFGSMTLAGTRHDPFVPGSPDTPGPKKVSEMLGDLQRAIPEWSLSGEDVLIPLSGLVPEKAKGDRVDDLSSFGRASGLFRVRSAKYTTAPITARRALGQVLREDVPKLLPVLRPKAQTVLTCGAFLDLHTRERGTAKAWVQEVISSEDVRTAEDFLARRMDWGWNLEEKAAAAEIVATLVLGGPPGA